MLIFVTVHKAFLLIKKSTMKKTTIVFIIIGLISIGLITFFLVETITDETTIKKNQNVEQEAIENKIPTSSTKPSTPIIKTASVSHTQVNVEWDYSGSPAIFSIFKKNEPQKYSQIDPSLVENNKYIDTDVICGKEYTYYIEASNSAGSTLSEESKVKVLNCPSITHITQEIRERYEQKELTPPLSALPMNKEGDLLRTFKMTATKTGFFPNEIIIPYKDSMQIDIFSTNQTSFTITSENLNLDALIQNGQGSILLNKPPQGIYTFSCNETCPAPQETFIIVVL